jgi:hypothetical protein
MYTALVLCTLLFQSFWCGLNSLQSSGNLVCEVDLNCQLNAFEYRVDRVANDNCSNDTASFVERENALLGDTEHLEYLDVDPSVRTSVNNSDLQNLDSLEFLFP